MTKLILTFIFLLSSVAWGTQVVIEADSLPYTPVSYDTISISGSKVTTTGTAFIINTDSIWFELGTDTIEYGTSGDDSYCIDFSTSANDAYITFTGGNLIGGTGSGNHVLFFGFSVSHDITFNLTNMTVNGSNAHIAQSSSLAGTGIYNILFNQGQFASNCTGYTSRSTYDGAAFHWDGSFVPGNGDYSVRYFGINLTTSPGQGIAAIGNGTAGREATFEIQSCTLTINAQNDFYSPPYSTFSSPANAYAIIYRNMYKGSYIKDSRILSGNLQQGGRGILFELCDGIVGDEIITRNNYINVHEGQTEATNFGVYGIRDRNGNTGLLIDSNTIVVTADSNASELAYEDKAFGWRHSSSLQSSNITFRHNNIQVISNSNGVIGVCYNFEGVSAIDTTLTIQENFLQTDSRNVQYSFAGDATGMILRGDTLKWNSGIDDANRETFHIGRFSNTPDCQDNIARDCVYLNGASDTDITFATGGTLEIFIQRTLSLLVTDLSNDPIQNAEVLAINSYGDSLFTDSTNASGFAGGIVSYWYESRTATDTTDYNDFTLWAKVGSDSTSGTLTVSATAETDTLQLAIAGGGSSGGLIGILK